MKPTDPRKYSLQELAQAAGLPARTIRFYVARELLAGPLTAGRGASYDDRHLDRLREIRELQAQGRTLAEIARGSSARSEPTQLPEPAPVWQYALTEDVTVWVRSGASPWRRKTIQKALAEFARALRDDVAGHDPQKG